MVGKEKSHAVVVLLLILVSGSIPLSAENLKAEKAAKLGAVKRKLTPLEPIFDTSLVPQPSHFEVSVKYTQIVYPDDPKKMLHGEAGVLDLSGEVKKDVLRGRVIEEERRTAIETVEHGVSPKFYVDLRKMEAKYAPDLAWMMETAIGAARRMAAVEAAKGEAEMEKELKSPHPKAQIPLNPKADNSVRDPQKTLDAALAESKERKNLKVGDIENALASAASESRKRLSSELEMPDPAGVKTPAAAIPNIPKTPQLSIPVPSSSVAAIPSVPKTDISLAEEELKAELLKAAKKQADDKKKEELDTAAKLSHRAVEQAQPVMDAILTFARQIPQLRLPSNAKPALKQTEPDNIKQIDWDIWHSKFAELAKKPILDSVAKAGNPSGSNTVEITVYADHRVKVSLQKAGKTDFDQAIVEAYKSLNLSPALDFPSGSRRSSISFLVDNKHEGAGAPLGVRSKSSTGDREILRH